MNKRPAILAAAFALILPLTALEKPNVIFIPTDDMGVGDVQALGNATSEIATPHMDSLARDGMGFLVARSSSSVCTPTHYSIITGDEPRLDVFSLSKSDHHMHP